jgi:hypothetical protein
MTDTLIVLLCSFLGLMLLGLPVAWSLLSSMLVWVVYGEKWRFLPIAAERIWQGMDVFVLMAVPLFILAGELINAGRITDRLIHFANVVFGWMRGGLAQVNIGASILFSGITGVALGDIAALGRVFIPGMVKQGYTAAYAAAVTASSSIIGPMVPPSLVAVIYGSMTGLSIGALMAATLIPGLVIGAVQMALVAVQARHRNFPRVEMDRSPRVMLHSTGQALVPLMIPVIILAGLMGGLMTPTEAGCGRCGLCAGRVVDALSQRLAARSGRCVPAFRAFFGAVAYHRGLWRRVFVGDGHGKRATHGRWRDCRLGHRLFGHAADLQCDPTGFGHVHRPYHGHHLVRPAVICRSCPGGYRPATFWGGGDLEPERRSVDAAARCVPVRG